MELIYLLKNRQKRIPGTKTNIAKTALIRLAQILYRDNDHTIKKEIDEYIISEGGSTAGIQAQFFSKIGASQVPIKYSDMDFKNIIQSIHPIDGNKRSQLQKNLHTILRNFETN